VQARTFTDVTGENGEQVRVVQQRTQVQVQGIRQEGIRAAGERRRGGKALHAGVVAERGGEAGGSRQVRGRAAGVNRGGSRTGRQKR